MQKIVGQRGSWNVTIGGEEFPVVHDTCFDWANRTYREGNAGWHGHAAAKEERWHRHMSFVAAKKVVVVQRDTSDINPARNGYVGLLYIYDVQINGDELTFKF